MRDSAREEHRRKRNREVEEVEGEVVALDQERVPEGSEERVLGADPVVVIGGELARHADPAVLCNGPREGCVYQDAWVIVAHFEGSPSVIGAFQTVRLPIFAETADD